MTIVQKEKDIIIKGIKDFDLGQTLECGQCFHFEKIDENEYGIVSGNHFLHGKQIGDEMICYGITEDEFRDYWWKYFDLDRDYGEIKRIILKKDPLLKEAVESKYGIHILNQEFHEVLISFIISQNKQIPHIKQIVRNICEKYGNLLGRINDVNMYSFPDISVLENITEEEYRDMKTGFRARYLRDASVKLMQGEVGSYLSGLSYEEAAGRLLSITGVGEKVANCVLLFGLGFREAFPVDVWIKRIMEEKYFDGKDMNKDVLEKYGKELFGQYGGYAQQYMFFFGRENNTGKIKKQENKRNKE